MRIADLGERDGWRCWLCEGDVDPEAPARSPWAGSIDHVVPRSRGGGSEPGNLRLAHRRCNGRRGSHLPELDWPASFAAVDPVPLWQALARLARKPGTREVVALVPLADRAADAAAWVTTRAERFLGGRWHAEVVPAGDLQAVWLTADPAVPVRDPGRPKPPRQ